MTIFETVSDETIKRGECTDIYFVRTEETLNKDSINPRVCMEVTASALPDTWAVFCGLSDVITLLEGLPITVDAMPEGTIFFKNEPVLRIPENTGIFAGMRPQFSGFSAMPRELPRLPPISRLQHGVVRSILLVHAASTRRLPG